MNFNDLAARSGITDVIRSMNIDTDSSGVLAATVKWFVRLIVLVVAFDALGLTAVSRVLQQLLRPPPRQARGVSSSARLRWPLERYSSSAQAAVRRRASVRWPQK